MVELARRTDTAIELVDKVSEKVKKRMREVKEGSIGVMVRKTDY